MKLCDLNSGKLKTKIELQRLTKTPAGGGTWDHVWDTYAIVWSAWKHASMHERQQAMKLESPVMHRVYIRYRQGVTAIDRVYYDGQAYQIRGVVDMENRRRWMELSVEEGVAAS